MEIELISRETIKPSLPTPSHLRIYPLSFIDNIMRRTYVPIIFFYKPNDISDQNFKISQLRKSLSQLLSKYYPFAGRLKDKITIECNDQGVSFLVAKIKNKLSEILQNPTDNLLNPLFPDELQWTNMDWSETLISFQINCFSCGGMAISTCVSHKVSDASTILNFMHDWSLINRKIEEENETGFLVLPVSNLLDGGASIFSQKDLPIFQEVLPLKRESNVVCKRFVFQPSMINFLKAMVTSSPRSIEVVTAWIYKCVVSIIGLNIETTPFNTVVDLRKKMVPPLSEKCVGNIIWPMSIVFDKKEMELEDLVCKIEEGLYEFNDVYPKIFGENRKDNLSLISKCLKQATDPRPENENTFTFSSWCRLPMYKTDFGWGKPTWVTTYSSFSRDVIILMDTKNGNGIEVMVNLKEDVMEKFEHEVELLQHASFIPNPSNVEHDA
ncbi:stemmadenine O-acetyltransferase-like [Trifolium pratense]|uniref:Uncharacterized protein n=1 Tax=Trifolium pratense TaxID=57577 RepID=A0ACB0KEP3_TRIPR|nr:stemmadenine O-acetyltransferase-like [Trifolium pratense]CAJ2655676.1 unnamed protein product [Trifolium pratense]